MVAEDSPVQASRSVSFYRDFVRSLHSSAVELPVSDFPLTGIFQVRIRKESKGCVVTYLVQLE